MDSCYFCSSTTSVITEEHVWPKWVSRLLFGQYNSDHFMHVRSTGDSTTGLWKSRYLDVTTTTVCAACNNEWLSVFEDKQIKPLATPLIVSSDPTQLTPAAQSLLAAWAYKMALLIEITNLDKPPEFFTAAERLLFRQTTLAHPLVRVFVSRYDYGQHPAHALTSLRTYTQRDGPRKSFQLKISTITAGHLAMQVMSVRSPESGELVSG